MIQTTIETEAGLTTVFGEMVEMWGYLVASPQTFGLLQASGGVVVLSPEQLEMAQTAIAVLL